MGNAYFIATRQLQDRRLLGNVETVFAGTEHSAGIQPALRGFELKQALELVTEMKECKGADFVEQHGAKPVAFGKPLPDLLLEGSTDCADSRRDMSSAWELMMKCMRAEAQATF